MTYYTGWHLEVMGQTFNIASPQDFLEKIKRDKIRFDNAAASGNVSDTIDMAINFAMSAWHFHDWLWKNNKKEIVNKLNLTKTQFQAHIRRKYPCLAVCDHIINGVKHGGDLDKHEYRLHPFETAVVFQPSTQECEEFGELMLGGTLAGQSRMGTATAIFNATLEDVCALYDEVTALSSGVE